MGGFGGMEAYRAMARQEKARLKKQEERRQQRSESVQKRRTHNEDGARIIESEEQDVGEELACPNCHLRYDFGMRCLDCDVLLVGVSFLTTPAPQPTESATLTGPRYCCEKCGSRGDSAERCEKCDHWELLDLHRVSDRRYAKVLDEQRRNRLRHNFSAAGLLAALAGLVVLLLGTVYVAPPALLIGLLLILGGGTVAAGGPISR